MSHGFLLFVKEFGAFVEQMLASCHSAHLFPFVLLGCLTNESVQTQVAFVIHALDMRSLAQDTRSGVKRLKSKRILFLAVYQGQGSTAPRGADFRAQRVCKRHLEFQWRGRGRAYGDRCTFAYSWAKASPHPILVPLVTSSRWHAALACLRQGHWFPCSSSSSEALEATPVSVCVIGENRYDHTGSGMGSVECAS